LVRVAEFSTLADDLNDIDPNSKDGWEIGSIIDKLGHSVGINRPTFIRPDDAARSKPQSHKGETVVCVHQALFKS
jgi:hypothetical protein